MLTDEIKQQILKLYPEYNKIYGPYVRKIDNRKIISLSCIGKKGSIAKQLARILLEIKLNRRLDINETVDHIDGDITNDAIDNLQLLSREDNAGKAAIRRKQIKDKCIYCKKEFILTRNQTNAYKWKGHENTAGPFCSRSCSGKYRTELQNNRIDKLDRPQYDIEYYRMQDSYEP